MTLPTILAQDVYRHWAAGRPDAALAAAWRVLDDAGDDHETRWLLMRLLGECTPNHTPELEAALRRLLADPDVDPENVSRAGWRLLLTTADRFPAAAEPSTLAAHLETDEFARELLHATFVADTDAEQLLTAVRRWLLLSGRSAEFPRAVEALGVQAAHNQGAWWFDDEERAALETQPDSAIAGAYRPARAPIAGASFDEPITRAVAEQYEAWPYPTWVRVTRRPPSSLAADVRQRDPDGPATIPPSPEILVPGCGTGHEPAVLALRYPDARICAVDISAASLYYAARKCEEMSLPQVSFRQLDLLRVAELGRSFDAIFCSGVLHHLPDPEAGWAALRRVLKPGGVMRILVYSTRARLRVQALRQRFTDLLSRPLDDDLLREARRRLIASGQPPVSRDFFTLSGVHDLLLHRHEDPFTVRRIERAIAHLGLRFVGFDLPTPNVAAQYHAEYPGDPLMRDFDGWHAFEKKRPMLFSGMYQFWCRAPWQP